MHEFGHDNILASEPVISKTDSVSTVQRNIGTRSRNHWCYGKAINIIYEGMSLDSVIQHAERMRHTVVCGLFTIFSASLSNDMIFGKTLLSTNLNVHTSSCTVPVILVRF